MSDAAALGPVLETPRLRLRPLAEGDLDALAAMAADPEVMRYLTGGQTFDREDTWRQIAMFVGHWTLRGFGQWTVEERATGTIVGRVGLHYPEGWPDREVGWVVARPHWGKGFAREAAAAALDHAFGRLGWARAISLIHPDNTRSIRVAEGLGERLEGQTTVRGGPVRVYAITAREWTRLARLAGRTI